MRKAFLILYLNMLTNKTHRGTKMCVFFGRKKKGDREWETFTSFEKYTPKICSNFMCSTYDTIIPKSAVLLCLNLEWKVIHSNIGNNRLFFFCFLIQMFVRFFTYSIKNICSIEFYSKKWLFVHYVFFKSIT